MGRKSPPPPRLAPSLLLKMGAMAHRLASQWHALFWRGAIAIAFAVTAFAWPIVTLTGLVLLFGFFAVVDGALALSIAVREEPRSRWSWALLLEGVVGIVAGALSLFVPGVALSVLIALVAVWAFATGALEIAAATALHRDGSTTSALVVGGAASILVAVIIVAWPSVGAAAIAWVLGGYAMVFGIVLVALAVRLRHLRDPRSGPMALGGGAP